MCRRGNICENIIVSRHTTKLSPLLLTYPTKMSSCVPSKSSTNDQFPFTYMWIPPRTVSTLLPWASQIICMQVVKARRSSLVKSWESSSNVRHSISHPPVQEDSQAGRQAGRQTRSSACLLVVVVVVVAGRKRIANVEVYFESDLLTKVEIYSRKHGSQLCRSFLHGREPAYTTLTHRLSLFAFPCYSLSLSCCLSYQLRRASASVLTYKSYVVTRLPPRRAYNYVSSPTLTLLLLPSLHGRNRPHVPHIPTHTHIQNTHTHIHAIPVSTQHNIMHSQSHFTTFSPQRDDTPKGRLFT